MQAISPEASEKIHRYAEEVMRFNQALNLTGAKSASEFLQRIVFPSLLFLEAVPSEGTLLDIGSGNGVPGIPLLLALPRLRGVLIERRQRRAEFLRHIVRIFRLQAEVICGDARTAPAACADFLVARAVAEEPALLQMAARHLKPNASAFLIVPRSAEAPKCEGWQCVRDWTAQKQRMRHWQRSGGST